jgi:hypothetical protein
MEVLQTSALPLGYAAAVSDSINILGKMQRLRKRLAAESIERET